ncbi:MAG TPA: carboxypeptidase regulatory-like domain-containing protein, partial [Ferruginibacter sp.]|nr:carboxypeptidase regulatory-like domain-containing protein [Ferruginibacter sp.]
MKIFLFNIIFSCLFSCSLPEYIFSQQTNSNVSGYIKSQNNKGLEGATIIISHEPTKSVYTAQSRTDGEFYFSNLIPGGPYFVTVSYVGYEPHIYRNLFVDFNASGNFKDFANNDIVAFILKSKPIELSEVVANANITVPGILSIISNHQMAFLPSISRNLQDYVRLVPQAKVNGDGLMSFAGQNNKLNAFFIDGANSNDILGVALSGTNGGQTRTPPISIEVLDKINILLSPYDVQYSNFTGGSINAITKSGSNEVKSSAWYYFRNQNMAGKLGASKLSKFFNQTYGTWVSGPLKKNKLFYFLSFENQVENSPQPFNFSDYKGNSQIQQISALSDSVKKKYNYDPGAFMETKEKLNAIRTLLKIDWNASEKNKVTISYR